ncbi:peptidase of plants and bacteria-domain-containing protein [Chaetomidium leptoderma]|uniref:Peptidase of plants and bacteria-domain-containing protein n=1 Tax=Chaetomidium leptoderma TaxID=669021 RepID=A0AAN6VRL0_9PEZI|nr:peptidase of plants and bacteria-domain-containing protein [Chaetomidium leptoderma]
MTLWDQTEQVADGPAVSTPSPVPLPDRFRDNAKPGPEPASELASGSAAAAAGASFPPPKLRLKIQDLDHPGAAKFLGAINVPTVFSDAVTNVLRLLYRSPSDKHTNAPPTRSVTLILRDMDGVAYTTGTDLDNDHKEIHFSLNYINSIHPASRLAHEITGVLTHELVHCYQWDAQGTCPGGLIEGVADWVRLNCDLSPPHWKKETAGDWDRGYQHTAYFLHYLELRFGEGTVRRLNDKLRQHKYKAEVFWPGLFESSVEKLYGDYVKKEKDHDEDCSK